MQRSKGGIKTDKAKKEGIKKRRKKEVTYIAKVLLVCFGTVILLCCSESVGILVDCSSSEESTLTVLGSGCLSHIFHQCYHLLRV